MQLQTAYSSTAILQVTCAGVPMSVWSHRLRDELTDRARAHAESRGCESFESRGGVRFLPHNIERGQCGNFEPESFSVIAQRPEYAARLAKAHSHRGSFDEPYKQTAVEMDSCMSSDALLMSVFCYPRIVTGKVAALLRVKEGEIPAFGVDGRVQRLTSGPDATEIDMIMGNVHVESKLTEGSFTSTAISILNEYADFSRTFELRMLPRDVQEDSRAEEIIRGYQLVRNVLAIVPHPERRFIVMLDARRPDLVHEWWDVHAAIHDAATRARCGIVFWQEIAAASPAPLREFLAERYGLVK